jgi:hypothetical protein
MSISEAAWIVSRSIALPLSSIPLFFILCVKIPSLNGSILTLSLSIPGLLYPVCFVLAFGFSAPVFLILFPGMLLIPLIALASIRHAQQVLNERRDDHEFLAARTLVTSGTVILMYASVWWEFHALSRLE